MSALLVLVSGVKDIPSTTDGQSFAEDLASPQFLAACVAALAAITAAIMTWNSSRNQRRQSDEHREIDFRRAQLNELYGPLLMLRQASKRTRELLPDQDANGVEWRLVDHIEEVRDGHHRDWEAAVEQILTISDEVDALLISKAGLFETLPPPESFALFLAHSRRLRMYWEERENQPTGKRIPFPGEELDRDIAAAVATVKTRLEKLKARGQ